jgi:hypothetical protein
MPRTLVIESRRRRWFRGLRGRHPGSRMSRTCERLADTRFLSPFPLSSPENQGHIRPRRQDPPLPSPPQAPAFPTRPAFRGRHGQRCPCPPAPPHRSRVAWRNQTPTRSPDVARPVTRSNHRIHVPCQIRCPVERTGYPILACFDWWGQPGGQSPGQVSTSTGGSVQVTPPLAARLGDRPVQARTNRLTRAWTRPAQPHPSRDALSQYMV